MIEFSRCLVAKSSLDVVLLFLFDYLPFLCFSPVFFQVLFIAVLKVFVCLLEGKRTGVHPLRPTVSQFKITIINDKFEITLGHVKGKIYRALSG